MKKLMIIIAVLLLLVLIFSKKESYVIPDEAIRLRIIANSNSIYDQYIKEKVKQSTERQLLEISNNSNTIEESRKNIISSLPNIKLSVKTTLNDNNYDEKFDIVYGYNYFPEKKYKNVIYPEGEYESLVITLGDGNGDNWWCVLFPPICFIETTEGQDVEYRFMIEDLFSKYTNK
ncbi:MAG TPA: stage II sporulation protein R [Bacilli bacterium]|nr:stage II sporulation protein R [Bacilli bacterium]